MIELPEGHKATWSRILWTELGLRQQERKREEVCPKIEALSYRTGESLGTEQRVVLVLNGEPLVEIHYTDRGWIEVEVQGVEAFGVRAKLSPSSKTKTIEQLDPSDHTYTID